MKANNPADFRATLAATLMLVVLAVAYEVAGRWPGQPGAAPVVAAPAPAARADTLANAVAVAAPVPKPAPEPCPPHPQVFSLAGGASWAARRPLLVRRYVGTVGRQAATAVLQWQNPDSVTVSFYLHRGGPAYELDLYRKRPGPAVLAAADDSLGCSQLVIHTLHGPTLVGTWRSAGRPQRLLLHESYTGALRYTFQSVGLAGDYRVPGACDYVPQVEHRALTLLSPLAAPLALQSRLAASPTALRRRLLADSESVDGDANASYRDAVRLNGFQLFSYETSSYVRSYGGTPDVGVESWLFDLRTGQELTVVSQFRPGYERPLRRLLTEHLLHNPAYTDGERRSNFDWRDDQGQPTTLVSLPSDGSGIEALSLTETGLEAAYSFYTLYNHGPSAQDFVLIPYAELRPLVRPGTPLARMLRARGMW